MKGHSLRFPLKIGRGTTGMYDGGVYMELIELSTVFGSVSGEECAECSSLGSVISVGVAVREGDGGVAWRRLNQW
jgi:TRAP-type C4-dicarboxylate transport system permease large subunit